MDLRWLCVNNRKGYTFHIIIYRYYILLNIVIKTIDFGKRYCTDFRFKNNQKWNEIVRYLDDHWSLGNFQYIHANEGAAEIYPQCLIGKLQQKKITYFCDHHYLNMLSYRFLKSHLDFIRLFFYYIIYLTIPTLHQNINYTWQNDQSKSNGTIEVIAS